jgi:hypothetical protein
VLILSIAPFVLDDLPHLEAGTIAMLGANDSQRVVRHRLLDDSL